MTESISSTNRGFLLGDGFFTTMRWYQQTLHHYEAHYERLYDSCIIFHILPPRKQWIYHKIIEKIDAHHLNDEEASVRVTFNRESDSSSRRLIEMKSLYPLVTIHIGGYSRYKAITPFYHVGVSPFRRLSDPPLSQIKHLGYQPNILGRYWAKDQGYNDIIILNEHNEVMSTSVGNIFLFIQEKWKTPPLSSGCLNGIMRRQILAHFPQIVEEYPITMMQLQKAQSGFFTNSLIGIQPFSAIEHRLLKDHAFIQEASDRINHYN